MDNEKTLSVLITPDEFGRFEMLKIVKSKYKDTPSMTFSSGVTIEIIVEELEKIKTDEHYGDER